MTKYVFRSPPHKMYACFIDTYARRKFMKKRCAVYFSGNLIMDSLEYFGYPAQKMGK